jgi:hypothetical protein
LGISDRRKEKIIFPLGGGSPPEIMTKKFFKIYFSKPGRRTHGF